MQVHWFVPTSDSRENEQTFWKHEFEEEMDMVPIRANQRAQPRVRAQPRIDTIDYDMIHFGFSRLLPCGRLPKDVVGELRQFKLIEGR